MRWKSGRRSSNIEDRRGRRVTRRAAGGGLGLIVLVIVALVFGVDPSFLLQSGGGGTMISDSRPAAAPSAAEEEAADFVSAVLADLEDTWHPLFRGMGRTYQEPNLVLFTGAVESACGFAQAAVRPFYCPADNKVYIDLSFFDDLHRRFGAPGDFAQAYVIARRLETGDLEEALGAAAAIGDDRIQSQSRGYVSPESFTHGSAAQRASWFRRGFENGDPGRCDTFAEAAQ
jgi:predicted metalloprotease